MTSSDTYTTPELRLAEAAGILGVRPETLRRWADSGKVPSVRTPGGERRFRREDIALVYADSPAATDHATTEVGE